MAKNINEVPYTELYERVQKLARAGESNATKIRGVIQDIYKLEIPAKFDWNFLLSSSSVTVIDEYHDGTLSATTGSSTVYGTSTTFSQSMVGRKIKPSSNDQTYDIVAYLNSTALTISPSFQGASNITGASYSIFQPIYALASDFDRFPKHGGVYRWSGGSKQILPEDQYARYLDDYQASATTPQKTRLVGLDTLGCQLFEFIPSPRKAANYGYDYYRTPLMLQESTQGTINSISANSPIVNGIGTRFTEAKTNGLWWFRVDQFGTGQDSTWYRISTISHDSQMTLATAFANSAVTAGASYTICSSPDMPSRMHVAVLYGSLRALEVDQNDPNAQFYHAQYAQVLSDSKRIYVSRPYSQDITGAMEDYRYRK